MDASLKKSDRRFPSTGSVEDTVAYLRSPYTFIRDHCKQLNSDIFSGRLLFEKTLFMTGAEASELFYDSSRFQREGAMPSLVKNVLLGKGGVQGLDDAPHLHRKQMFMKIMTPQSITRLSKIFEDELESRMLEWQQQREVQLYSQMCSALTLSVCAWAGVELEESSRQQVTRDLSAMFNKVGKVGWSHVEARMARRRGNRWAAEKIEAIRQASPVMSDESQMTPAGIIAFHRDLQGQLLPVEVAAVELLNILRPTVAVAVFITLGAHAMHQFPEARPSLPISEEDLRCLVQEIRRFYPFFPLVAARTKSSFDWKGWQFPVNQRVLLDLYGTNHDARIWAEPDCFKPSRFLHDKQSPYDFIPQGGGDFSAGHRCAGEWITISLMGVAMRTLLERLSFQVPAQNLMIDMSTLPALPGSGFLINDVKVRSHAT